MLSTSASSESASPRRAPAPSPLRPHVAASAFVPVATILTVLRAFMGARSLDAHKHLVWSPAVLGAWIGAVEYFTALFVRVEGGGVDLGGAITLNAPAVVGHLARLAPADALNVRTAHLRAFLADERTGVVVALAGVVVQRQALARILEAAAELGAAGERARIYTSPGGVTPGVGDAWNTLVIRGPRFVGLATVLGADEGDRHDDLTVYDAEAALQPEPAPAEPDVPIDRGPAREELPPLARTTARLHTPATVAGVR